MSAVIEMPDELTIVIRCEHPTWTQKRFESLPSSEERAFQISAMIDSLHRYNKCRCGDELQVRYGDQEANP